MQIQYRFDPDAFGILAMKLKADSLAAFLEFARPRLRPDTMVANL